MEKMQHCVICRVQFSLQRNFELTVIPLVLLRVSHLWHFLFAIFTPSLPQRIPEGMLNRYLWFLKPQFQAA